MPYQKRSVYNNLQSVAGGVYHSCAGAPRELLEGKAERDRPATVRVLILVQGRRLRAPSSDILNDEVQLGGSPNVEFDTL